MNARVVKLVLATAVTAHLGCARPTPPEHAAPAHGDEASAPHLPGTVRLSTAAMAEAGIRTWKVEPVDLAHLLALNGSVEHDEDRLLQLASNVRGRVAAILVDLGARVRKGDALVRLESVELGRAREDFVRARSAWQAAERACERARRLVAAKAISAGESQAREAACLSARASAESAERTLRADGDSADAIERLRAVADGGAAHGPGEEAATLTLRAPFAGRVIDRKVTPGALVEALQPLVTVADLSSVWVFLKAYEKDLALLREGLPVVIRSEAWAHESFRGRVDFVDSVVDEATRTVRLRATVRNPGERLRPGMFVRAQVDVPKPQQESRLVLAVPQSALQTLEGRTVLFEQTVAGVFALRFVEVGHTFEGFTEVLGGLEAGDVIVTEGSFVLKSEFARAELQEEH